MEVLELHRKAMDLADRADWMKSQSRDEEAEVLYRKSLEAEQDAANSARQQHVGEPTESVLFRSAASLAYVLKDYREAERLIGLGLAGNPPAEIADELRTLYDAVSMERKIGQTTSLPNQKENVTITIPVHERGLLDVLIKKFGWACAF